MRSPDSLYAALRRCWSETPTVATIGVLRGATGGYYLFGGLTVLIGGLLLDESTRHRLIIAAVAAFGALAGGAILGWGARFDRRAYYLLQLLATALITWQIVVTHATANVVALGSAYLFVMVNSVLLFSLREALVQMVVIQAAFAVVMKDTSVSLGARVIVVGCTLGMTVIVGWLARMASAAELDPLTHLPNRRALDRRLQDILRRVERDGSPLSLALLDFDFFKRINDRSGHVAGDTMLAEAVRTWEARLPAGVLLARYGGDAFALVMPGLALGRAADLADELRAAVPGTVTVSAGVATWADGDTASTLVGRADVALFDAKTAGRDQLSAYGDPGRASSEIETAIAEGQMRMYLQPVVRIASEAPVGYEALVRWEHPRRGLLMPDTFISRAESSGAIHALGSWILEQACRAATALDDPDLSIGVNVTVPELRRTDYAAEIGRLLERWDLPGHQLILEVTEGAFDDSDPQIEQTLQDVRAMGVPIAIDDFGSGHSSLRRIEQLPIDLIKVDGSLVRAIRDDADEAPILEAVATMARRLGLRLVAEHVETEHHAEVLRRAGYDFGQGYLFGRPAPADEVVGAELPRVESNHRR